MERSSPLAAMRPSVMPGPWQGRSMIEYNPNYLAPYTGKFNFKDLSMGRPKSNPDYFTCKPVRESSPTSSLAVDLSQNFHIDRSPQLPTPRRSLFTRNCMRQTVATSLTPPMLSSSPGRDVDMMDHSPLPHKPAFPVLLQAACSPTPEPTPPMHDLFSVPAIVRTLSQPEDASSPKQRKALAFRPLFRRGASAANIPARPKSVQPNQFQFGPPLQPLSKTMLESFAESPPSERKLPSSSSNSSLFGSANGFVNNGSPLNIARKPLASNGVQPRGRYRRTQSMQCNNATKVIRQEKRFCTSGSLQLQNPLATDDEYKLKLPNFKNTEDLDGLPRITKETCIDVLLGKYVETLGEYSIVDCRFEYEYEGGHIDGAVNFNDKEELAKRLFNNDLVMSQKAIIFHCEYSAHRAPIMAKFIRQRDRAINQDNYPKLTYPEIYILDGGYSTFFQSHPSRCYPQDYVEMDSKDHENACELGMAKVKRRAKLSRAQTYAFGQSITLGQRSHASQDVALAKVPSMGMHSTFDSMDIDFSSPIQMATANFHHSRSGFNLGTRRQDSF